MRIFLSLLAVAGFAAACATPIKANLARPEQDQFFESLSKLCGQSFAGRMVTDHPLDAALKGKSMVMHVRTCTADTIRIPLHVEDDRSRTWVITKGGAADYALQLKHDHRHKDGSEDVITQYGGHTLAPGSSTRQEFPADMDSKVLFERTGRPNSSLNTWAIEIHPNQRFIYEVTRPNRHVRFEFDLSVPVASPPAPWGASAGR